MNIILMHLPETLYCIFYEQMLLNLILYFDSSYTEIVLPSQFSGVLEWTLMVDKSKAQ